MPSLTLNEASPEAFAGHLRAARSMVAPQIPDLAPRLAEDPEIIRGAVVEALESQGVDSSRVHEHGLNKAERQAMSSFAIGVQREYLTVGTGAEARFTYIGDTMMSLLLGRNRLTYEGAMHTTLSLGATYVEWLFSHGDDPEHKWWPLAEERYRDLARIALDGVRDPFFSGSAAIPAEGRELRVAMRTHALDTFMVSYLAFIRMQVPSAYRVQAAHDLSHLLTHQASVHFKEADAARAWQYPGTVVMDNEGTFRVVYPEGKRSNTIPRLPNLPNPRLKCPAHARYASKVPTNLEVLAHAAINAAPDYGML